MTGNALQETPSQGGKTAVAFSPDGQHLAAAARLGFVKLLDVSSLRESLVIPVTVGEEPVTAFHPDGKRIAANLPDGTVRMWDVANGRELVAYRGQTAQVDGIAFSPCGRWIAATGRRQVVEVWEVATGKPSVSLKLSMPGYCVAFSPDSQVLGIATSDGAAHLWRFQTGETRTSFAKRSDYRRGSLAFSRLTN
ncbi:MAG: WD40 repeat domain-containing protein [Pirellulaceae bacterium]